MLRHSLLLGLDGGAHHARAVELFENILVVEREVEIELCEPGVLPRDALRARAVSGADRLDEDAMLVLRDDEYLTGIAGEARALVRALLERRREVRSRSRSRGSGLGFARAIRACRGRRC